jgi:PP-loop superfamily ATP-utilizing enzyme
VDGMKCKFYRDHVNDCGLCQKVCSYATQHAEIKGGPLVAQGLNPADEESQNA